MTEERNIRFTSIMGFILACLICVLALSACGESAQASDGSSDDTSGDPSLLLLKSNSLPSTLPQQQALTVLRSTLHRLLRAMWEQRRPRQAVSSSK